MTQEEKIKDLEQRLALMDADNSALAVELAHFKKVAAGAKGRNKQLAERVEHYKNLDLEGDLLYEKALADVEKKNVELNEKDKVIIGLQSQVTELNAKLTKVTHERNELKATNGDLELALRYEQMPWWKKIFG
jgi:chromosome segregation ATPase